MDTFQEHLKYYRSQHATLGCKLTHMLGIPLIAASVPFLLIQWQVSVLLFVLGWILQFIGHYTFEKNSPVFLGNPLDPVTYLVALAFCAEEWGKLLTGKPLVDPPAPSTGA